MLPNLRALNFVVEGLLGEGVAARPASIPQAKALGEWLRARHLDIPEAFIDDLGKPSEHAQELPDASAELL